MKPPLVYPMLGAIWDLGFMRLSGNGLGNSLLAYFRALATAEAQGARVIVPAWMSIKPGAFLRGERSKRTYTNLFRAGPGQLDGAQKAAALAKWRHSHRVPIDPGSQPILEPGLNLTSLSNYTFRGLHSHRAAINAHLAMVYRRYADHSKLPPHTIAAHVRLGDFSAAATEAELRTGRSNTRIPLNWYGRAIDQLLKQHPRHQVAIFSDGTEAELASLLGERRFVFRGRDDMDEILAMSTAKSLVASNSTFSAWASFIGGMPTVRMRTDPAPEVWGPPGSGMYMLGLETDARLEWASAP